MRAVVTDWKPRNRITTPLAGTPSFVNSGIIKAVMKSGEKISVAQIDYQEFDEESMIGGKNGKEQTLPFPIEILDHFMYVEDKSITHVLNQIYEPIEERNVKNVSVVKVTAALKEDGYLVDEPNSETGKMRKVPSEKGKELGIYLVEREYNGRMYEAVTYNKNAQEYVVELIRKLIGAMK